MESIDIRKNTLREWLTHSGIEIVLLKDMMNDASFRRYFRVFTPSNSFVAMDAPPLKENCRPFVAVAHAIREHGLHAPEIIKADVERGFLLMTDFGDLTYLKALNTQNADVLYHRALNALAVLQSLKIVRDFSIPYFTGEFMWQEWIGFKEWFLYKLLGLSLSTEEKELDQCYKQIVESAVAQPQVFMHRDYHSANLMVLSNDEVGILDFQDAFIGPVTYDLISLLRDCYIDWPQECVLSWVLAYWQKLTVLGVLRDLPYQEFLRMCDWMGLQRHLKTLLTFARKYVRDEQVQYLNYIPRTLSYLITVSRRYPQFNMLHDYLKKTVEPAFLRVRPLCVA